MQSLEYIHRHFVNISATEVDAISTKKCYTFLLERSELYKLIIVFMCSTHTILSEKNILRFLLFNFVYPHLLQKMLFICVIVFMIKLHK